MTAENDGMIGVDASTPQGDVEKTVIEEVKQEEPEGDKPKEAAGEAVVEDSPKKQVDPQQKKISKLAYENRELKRRIEQVLGAVEKAVIPQNQEVEPKLEDYGTFEEFLNKRDEYRDKKREATQKVQPNPQAEELSYRIDSLHEAGAEKYDDFKESVLALKITDPMRDAVLSYDDADTQAELAYYLSKNQKEADKIAQLSPLRQIAEIGKIEAKLNQPAPTKRPSKAPDPIEPVGGKETRSDPLASAKTDQAWIEARDKQERDAYLARRGKR